MDFLAGTLHIFIIYAALFVIFCLPPYTAAWARLVQRLNALRINGPRLARVFGLSAPLILLAAILIGHLFQFHKELEISFWLLFAPASFAVLPLAAAFFGAASWAAYKRDWFRRSLCAPVRVRRVRGRGDKCA